MAGQLPHHRVAQVARLMGELGELGLGSQGSRQHFVDSLLKIVGASVGAVVYDPTFREGAPTMSTTDKVFTSSGFDAATAKILDTPLENGCSVIPTAAAMMRQLRSSPTPTLLSASEVDLMSSHDWNRSAWVNDVAHPHGLDRFLATVNPFGDGVVEATGFMRQKGDRAFSDEDRALLHVVHEASGRMFRDEGRRATLAPRVEETLNELLTGATDKEIAQRLEISVYTVRQYVKTIFRAYGVTSRALLIARYGLPVRAAS